MGQHYLSSGVVSEREEGGKWGHGKNTPSRGPGIPHLE